MATDKLDSAFFKILESATEKEKSLLVELVLMELHRLTPAEFAMREIVLRPVP